MDPKIKENLNKAFENLKKKYKCVTYYDNLTDSPDSDLEKDEQVMPGLFPRP